MSSNNALLKSIKDLIPNNVLTLVSGSVLAQLIPLLATIVLTRLYSEAEFGVFFVFSSTLQVLSAVSTLNYEVTPILPKKDSDAKQLIILSFIISIIVFLALHLIYGIFRHQIHALILQRKQVDLFWIKFIPIAVLCWGIFQAIINYFTRINKFRLISAGRVIRATAFSILQLAFGFVAFTQKGLIVGYTGGLLISIIFLLLSYRKLLFFGNFKSVSIKRMMQLAQYYKKVRGYNTLIRLINILSSQLPIFMFTSFFSLEATALYGMANRIVAAPMGIISRSFGEVFYKEASELENRKAPIMPLIKITLSKLAKIGITPFALVALLSPMVFRILLGEEWEEAGKIAQILTIWLFFSYLYNPLMHIHTILKKQQVLFYYNIAIIVFRFLSLFVGGFYFKDIFITIWLFTITNMSFNIFIIVYSIKLIKVRDAKIILSK